MSERKANSVFIRAILYSFLILTVTYIAGLQFFQSHYVSEIQGSSTYHEFDWNNANNPDGSERGAQSNEVKELAQIDPVDSAEVALAEGLLVVAPPPFSPDVFPCTDCHEEGPDADTTPTEELFHDEIVLDHFTEELWCYSCHNLVERDELHLSNNQLIPFTESYRLCGQCHGTQLRDWKAGDHGKRSGSWSGKKTYLLCAHCHNPHSPKTEPMEPMPPPIRQEQL